MAKTVLGMGIPLRVAQEVDGHTIRFSATSFVEYLLRAQLSYTREQVTMAWIRDCIQPDDVVYDVGANVGAYSLLIGKKVAQGKGKVLSFEPESANFHALNRNVLLNGLSGIVLPYAIAFGDANRASTFFLSSTVPGSAMHGLDRPESEGVGFEAKHVQGVYVMSMDQFCASSAMPFPNHVKIDVDGSERDIVASMSTVLRDPRLKSIMIEISGDASAGEVEGMIKQAGFKEKAREKWDGKNVYNVLFTRLIH